MFNSYELYKLSIKSHQFKVGEIYVYEGKVYPKHIGKIITVDNQTIVTSYNQLNPLNCRLATNDEIEQFISQNNSYFIYE